MSLIPFETIVVILSLIELRVILKICSNFVFNLAFRYLVGIVANNGELTSQASLKVNLYDVSSAEKKYNIGKRYTK